MSDRLKKYLDEHQKRYIEYLKEWLAIPSISTLKVHSDDVYSAAEWLRNLLVQIGFSEVRTIPTNGHPLVYSEWLVDEKQPTLLIYGHYDVQPVDPESEWLNPPFEPTIREGNIYARGASDDKGQVLLVLAALEAWIKGEGHLPVNIKLIFEGEEEAGGDGIERFVVKNQEMLQADAVLICDTQMFSEGQPSIINGLRGILYAEIEVKGAERDLHSGSFGGVAPNPLHAICLLLSRIKGEDGIINIEELKDVRSTVSTEEEKYLKTDPLNVETALKDEMGANLPDDESGFSPLERMGIRPTFEVHGIRGGFTGEGAKTVIPAEATAKVSLRLPAEIDPDEAFGWLDTAVTRYMPAGYRTSLKNLHGGKGLSVSSENEFIQAAIHALTAIYGKEPVCMREGGSIPIAALFASALHLPVVLMGFGLPDDRVHAPNEKFSLNQYRLGMRTVAEFLGRLQR